MVKKFLSILLLSIFASIFIIPSKYAASNEDFNALYDKEIDNLIVWIEKNSQVNINEFDTINATEETFPIMKDNLIISYLPRDQTEKIKVGEYTRTIIKFEKLNRTINLVCEKQQEVYDKYIALSIDHCNDTCNDTRHAPHSHSIFLSEERINKDQFNKLEKVIKSAKDYIKNKKEILLKDYLENKDLSDLKKFME